VASDAGPKRIKSEYKGGAEYEVESKEAWSLESELGEEPLVLALSVMLLEELLDSLARLRPLGRVGNRIGSDAGRLEVEINSIAALIETPHKPQKIRKELIRLMFGQFKQKNYRAQQTYRVGIIWLKLAILRKGLIRDRFSTFFCGMLFVTFKGSRAIPAITQ
jgi:hypothetical protein